VSVSIAIRPSAGRARALRAALFSTYPPRACGIATFSFDLRSALLDLPGIAEVSPVVVVEEPSRAQRPQPLATVSQAVRSDYVAAAKLLGQLNVDVVLLEHEFGIFGGPDGDYVLAFAQGLAQPLVVTLHTILSQPTRHQRQVLTALCDQASRVIVMTDTARRLLIELGAATPDKICVVPHGAPIVLGRRADAQGADRSPPSVIPAPRRSERLRSHFLLSTFGLLSAGKGLETAIKALALIVERHPDVLYVIAGRTHPQVAAREGEQYRTMLERLVVELDLGDHVEFDDRFLSIDELADLLAVTDVFVTPYRSREQIASGSLTFALAAGCAAVSTPYWYAQDMLASGAGQTVPFDDPRALAEAVCAFAGQPDLLTTARREARRIGSQLAWPSVAKATATVLHDAVTDAPRRTPPRQATSARPRFEHEVSRSAATARGQLALAPAVSQASSPIPIGRELFLFQEGK
jgi:glycosyltransferase involved in cell wall biosynthesis